MTDEGAPDSEFSIDSPDQLKEEQGGSESDEDTGHASDYEAGTSDSENPSNNESSDEDGPGEQSEGDDSLNGALDKCSICLRIFRQQEIGTPNTCEHCFYLNCILDWADASESKSNLVLSCVFLRVQIQPFSALNGQSIFLVMAFI